MGLFDFFRRKKNPLEETREKLFNQLFPGGKKDIEAGAKVLQLLLNNKIDIKTAVQIYTRSATLAKTTEHFDKESLRIHLAGYSLKYFSEPELDSYYEFLTAIRTTTQPINTTNSGDFYDKIFDSLLETGVFTYPYSGNSTEDVIFAAFPDETMYVNENKQESRVVLIVYEWLRSVAKMNKALHSHIIRLTNEDNTYSYDEKIDFISRVVKNKSIEQLFSDPNAVNQVFIRAKAYNYMLEKLTDELLTIYSEGEDKVDDYVARAKKDYLATSKIIQVINLTFADIFRIFLRDTHLLMLISNEQTAARSSGSNLDKA